MLQIWRILAPVDFSDVSEVSCQYALNLARAFQAQIHFLHVIQEFSLSARLFFPQRARTEETTERVEEERRRAQGRIQALLERLRPAGVRWECLVEKGEPFVKILQTAESLRPDVVVQGVHGTTGLEMVVLGGTAERVIRHANCPVISLKPQGFPSLFDKLLEGIGLAGVDRKNLEEEKRVYRFPPRKVLCPTDYSEQSRFVLDYAARIARTADAELLVLHATDEEGPEEMASDSGQDPELDRRSAWPALEQMEELIREMAALYEGLRISPRILKSSPTTGIRSVGFEEDVDLVVTAAQEGPLGLGALLGGTVSDRLIRNAPCPVLTVRPKWKMEKVERRFSRVYRKLSALDLQRISDENQALIDEDLLRDPAEMKKSALFLNYYSQEGLVTALEEYGIYGLLRKKGFDEFVLSVKVDDVYRHCARVYWGGVEDRSRMLIELILREGTIRSAGEGQTQDGVAAVQNSLLIIEWLCLQNPSACFSPDRPPLPGQTHPGLGIGYEILGLLVLMARRTRKDGLLNRPQFYHNARVYHERFKFFDPVREGRLLALMRDTGDDHLTDVSWAIHHGCLRDGWTGEQVLWEGGDQIDALSHALQDYFISRRYRDIVWETVANTRYRVDWECFAECMRMKETRG